MYCKIYTQIFNSTFFLKKSYIHPDRIICPAIPELEGIAEQVERKMNKLIS